MCRSSNQGGRRCPSSGSAARAARRGAPADPTTPSTDAAGSASTPDSATSGTASVWSPSVSPAPTPEQADALAAGYPADVTDPWGKPLDPAARRLYALRGAGYTGPIDQDGYPVTSGAGADALAYMARQRGEDTPWHTGGAGGGGGRSTPPPPPSAGGPADDGDTDGPVSIVNVASGTDRIGIQAGQVFGAVPDVPGGVRVGRRVRDGDLDPRVREQVRQARAAAAEAAEQAQVWADRFAAEHPEGGSVNVRTGDARVGLQADTVIGPVVVRMPRRRQ